MPREAFLDSGYAIALAAASDQLHERAVALAEQIEAAAMRLVTTRAVLLEIGNALSKQRYRPAAVQLLSALESDPNVEIVPVHDDLYARAFQLFRHRSDKEWSLIDCISFVVMEDRGLTEALTPDKHFEQGGFTALLRNAFTP